MVKILSNIKLQISGWESYYNRNLQGNIFKKIITWMLILPLGQDLIRFCKTLEDSMRVFSALAPAR